MAVLWLLLRVRWRRSLAPALAVALLIGGIGGFVLAAASAARRVETAYQRFATEIDAPDVAVIPYFNCGPVPGITCEGPATGASGAELIAGLRESAAVEKARLVESLLPYFIDENGESLLGTVDDEFGCFDGDRSVQLVATASGGARDQVLPFRLEGKLPEPGSGAIVLARATAEREGLHLGDHLRLAGWCGSDGDPIELAVPITLELVGVAIGPLDVEPPGIELTLEPAFVDPVAFDALLEIGAEAQTNAMVWLIPTASEAEVVALLDSYQVIIDFRERAPVFDEALASDADLLWLLAGIGAIGGLLILTPVIGRNLRDSGPNVETLVALGAQRPMISREAVAHTCSLAVVGVALAAVAAIPMSAFMPRGLAEAIQPQRQLRVDAQMTMLGIVILLIVVVSIGLVPAWRLGIADRPIRHQLSDRGRGIVGRVGLRPATRTGVLAAVGNPVGPRQVSPWPSLVSMVVAAAVGVASITYLAGLRHLERTPAVLGWNWDALINFEFDESDPQRVPELIDAIGALDVVEEITVGTYFPPRFLFIPDADIGVWPWSFATGPDAITPTMINGRAPEGPDEVVIDLLFAEQTGLGIGDVVVLARATLIDSLASEISQASDEFGFEVTLPPIPDSPPVAGEFEITGISVLPLDPSAGQAQVAFTFDGFANLVEPTADEVAAAHAWLPDDAPPEVLLGAEAFLANNDIDNRAVYLRFAGDRRDAVAALLEVPGMPEVVAPTSGQVLSLIVGLNVDRNDRVPVALALMVAVAFMALTCYLLFFSIRSRRFEFAVMRALGLSTSGVRRSIAAQAITTVLVVLLVAVPIGLAVGRWAWLEYARDLAVLPVSVVPWRTISFIAVGSFAVVAAAALTLGWPATRRSPGPDLRSE